MSIAAAATALGFAGSVSAATAPSHAAAAPKKTNSPANKKKAAAPKLSKWQQHVLEMMKASAPGDEYFGRMKMSYLGINNTFHDDAIRAGAYTTDSRLIGHVAFADEALTSWAKKYPNDPQLARSYFLAFQFFRKVWTPDGQQKAWDYAHVVIKKWPSSYFGKALQKDLSIGFTEHYFATPTACVMLEAASSASPSASPSPTPEPTPTPTTAPGQPKIDILPVPCFTPSPSPSPIPLPTGSLSPQPSSSASPSASPSASASPSPSASPASTPTTTPTPTPTPTHRP